MDKNKSKVRRLVTAALPYINNVPHLGHIVGSHLPADIFARYCRLKGYETLFVGGSDDNGTPAVLAAKEIGVDINTFEDVVHGWHKRVYDWFGISYDNFSRTSRPIHHENTRAFFKKIESNGFIQEKEIEQYFCNTDSRFLPDRYIRGNCPNCGAPSNGDQCEKCGKFIETKDLLEPKCTLCGSVPVLRSSRHLFLELNKLSPKISDWLETKEETFRPQVLNLARGWIKEGLQSRCITRDLEQGVKVPVKGFENKVFYVWFDAPIGYISATQEVRPESWRNFWQGDSSQIYHFLGKDNIPFHTIFWPGMLIANGEYNLPKQVVGLQYLTFEGGKFSKSQKRGIFCDKLLESDLDSDVLRSYGISVIPESNDTEFRWTDLQRRTNDELIGTYANFFNRTLSFINNKCGGKLTAVAGSLIDMDINLLEQLNTGVRKVENHLERAEIRDAYSSFLAIAKEGNKYFDYNAPWKLIKEDPARANVVLNLCAEVCRVLAITGSPFLPRASKKGWLQLNLPGNPAENGSWDTAYAPYFPRDHTIGKNEVMFSRITEDKLNYYRETLSTPTDLRTFF